LGGVGLFYLFFGKKLVIYNFYRYIKVHELIRFDILKEKQMKNKTMDLILHRIEDDDKPTWGKQENTTSVFSRVNLHCDVK
jgi:hypothetical protein